MIKITRILIGLASIFGLGCSHSIQLRSSHFATPVVSDTQWGGHVTFTFAKPTTIKLVDDISSNPPNRTKAGEVEPFGELSLMDEFLTLGVDLNMNLYQGAAIYLDGNVIGLKWQFLNHGASIENWVASAQAGYGTFDGGRARWPEDADSEAETKGGTLQFGGSVGYKLEKIAPYFSFIQSNHTATTDVSNDHGSFGPYDDSGTHRNYALGISSHGTGFHYGAEYNIIDIKWGNEQSYQYIWGAKLGFAW